VYQNQAGTAQSAAAAACVKAKDSPAMNAPVMRTIT